MLAVTASAGPAGGDGEEQFQFTVCSPSWLSAQPRAKGFAFCRHTLLLERWDPELVDRAIRDLCRRTEGESWTEVASKLSRFGRWEFEDYSESQRGTPRAGARTRAPPAPRARPEQNAYAYSPAISSEP